MESRQSGKRPAYNQVVVGRLGGEMWLDADTGRPVMEMGGARLPLSTAAPSLPELQAPQTED